MSEKRVRDILFVVVIVILIGGFVYSLEPLNWLRTNTWMPTDEFEDHIEDHGDQFAIFDERKIEEVETTDPVRRIFVFDREEWHGGNKKPKATFLEFLSLEVQHGETTITFGPGDHIGVQEFLDSNGGGE